MTSEPRTSSKSALDVVGPPEKGIVWPLHGSNNLDTLVGERLPGNAFTLPVMTIDEQALAKNISAMANWCTEAGVDLAPHAKTTMSEQLLRRQMDAGAWGLTAATISQVMSLRSMGFTRILLANELLDRVGVSWILDELNDRGGFEFLCYVDSAQGVEFLDREVTSRSTGRRLPVLVELGHSGGRTGCRTPGEAEALALKVRQSAGLILAGVAGYEGSVGHDSASSTLQRVRDYATSLGKLADRLHALVGYNQPFIVSAGGSAYFDVVAEALVHATHTPVRRLLRSGAYVTHDDGFYRGITPAARGVAGAPQFQSAVRVLAHVLSRPEPKLAIAGAGRRDVPWDEGLPKVDSVASPDGEPKPCAGLQIERLNDQHAFLKVPSGSSIAQGDVISLAISHPCTVFDKWRVIPIVRDGRVVEVATTRF